MKVWTGRGDVRVTEKSKGRRDFHTPTTPNLLYMERSTHTQAGTTLPPNGGRQFLLTAPHHRRNPRTGGRVNGTSKRYRRGRPFSSHQPARGSGAASYLAGEQPYREALSIF
jgi:hypothetical protein